MRVSDIGRRLGIAVAGMLAVGVTTAGSSSARPPEAEWETIGHIQYADDETMHTPGTWHFYPWEQQGGHGLNVVADRTEPAHHDGSLRLATPKDGDKLALRRDDFVSVVGEPFLPALADFTGSYAMNVRSGPPVPYELSAYCRNDDGDYRGVTIAFAGPFAEKPGWHTYDVSQDGQAQWKALWPIGFLGTDSSHTLAEFQAECPDGVIHEHGFRLGTAGAVTHVDAVVINGVATNFKDLTGTAGDDRITGGSWDDQIFGYGGDDTLLGRDGSDHLEGGKGRDVLRGGDGDDVIRDGAAADTVYGGDGRDAVLLAVGADNVLSGHGRDRIYLRSDGKRDVIDCGPANDLVQYVDGVERRDRLINCERVNR